MKNDNKEKSATKVLFLIPALTAGGAERVMVNILRNINRDIFNIHLVLFQKTGDFLGEVPPDIRVHALADSRMYFISRWLIYFRLKRIISYLNPEVVLSFMWYPNLLALLVRKFSRIKFRLLISERSNVAFSTDGPLMDLLRSFAIRRFYGMADRIIVNSREMKQQFQQIYKIASSRLKVIYNPVDTRLIDELSKEPVEFKWYKEDIPIIVAVGRLTKEKGYEYLIRAVKILSDEGNECRLVVLGKGPEKSSLDSTIKDLDLGNRVALPGYVQNPYKYMARSSVFVLSSLYEGFPNSLLEAFSLGVPSVATLCPTGPAEIITDGVNGLLVPPGNERAIAEAIRRLLCSSDERERFKDNGRKTALEFRADKIIEQYEKSFLET
jgi:glycosyltransferase involved in cell wall biosynthesis